MARQTTNYGYNISEGTDLVNPLVDIFPNWEAIDTDLKAVSDSAVGGATELTTGTVHALTRSDSDRDVFVFTATSNFTAGDTFTLDGNQVSALTPAGEQLATGCYIIGSDVLVAVHGTLMTMYVSPTKVTDSDKLDGHDSTYFATASDLSDVANDVSDISDKVGTGVLQTTAQNCVGAINELNGAIPFLDTTDITVLTSDFDHPVRSWTATKDCVVCVRVATNVSLGNVIIYVDGVEVYFQFVSTSAPDVLTWQRIPLKTGQQISMNTTGAGCFLVKAIGVGL